MVLGIVVVWWLKLRQSSQLGKVPQQEYAFVREESATPATSLTPQDERKQGQRPESPRAIVQAIEKTNVPIQFWGRVVDQNQGPIPNVSVRYSYSTEHAAPVGAAWAKQQMHQGEATTDATGHFTVSGINGHVLNIESLTKEGYSYKARGARVYNYYGDTPSGKFAPEASKPVLFVMINKSIASPLVSYGGNFGKTLRVPGDGTQVRWDLWKGQADPQGELQFTFKRDPAVLARVGKPLTWSAKIGVVSGGIVEAPSDEPIRRAPEEGYFPEVDYPKAEQKRGVAARSFYIKTRDGRYGRIEVDLYPDDEGATARCLLKVAINPSGSRDLEGE